MRELKHLNSKIIKLYKEGYKPTFISKKLKCSISKICKLTRKLNLTRSLETRYLKYSVNEDYFDIIGDEQAWLIGLLAADGCIHKNKYISLGQSGPQGLKLIKYVKQILNFTGKVFIRNPRKKTHQTEYVIQITSKKLCDQLRKYNIIPRKSLVYKFPIKLKPYLYSFLRGYIEGDGCIRIYKINNPKKYLGIGFLGTSEFINKCQELIPIKSCNVKIKRCKNVNDLKFQGVKAVQFGNLLYENKNLYSSYKYKTYLKYLKYFKK